MYINTETLETLSLRGIKLAHSNVSLPREPDAASLESLGYALVQPTPRPAGDVVTEGQPTLVEGEWHQTWEVREYTADESAAALAEAKAAKLDEINAAYVAEAQPLIKWYPEIEIATWPLQQEQAKAYQAWLDGGSVGTAPPTPTLDPILMGRNSDTGSETMADLVAKVLAKADLFNTWQTATGKRHRLEKAVKAASDVVAVQAIGW